MDQILFANNLLKEIVTAIIMLYKNTKAMVRFPDGDVIEVLQRDIWIFTRFCRCWLLISDSVSFFLYHLNSLIVFLSVKAAKKEKERRKEEREDIFSIST